MNIYDESGKLLESAPDLSKGKLVPIKRLVEHHPAIPEQVQDEVMEGTKDLHRLVPVSPFVPAYDEFEDAEMFVPYTSEELEEMGKPTDAERLDAVEAAVMELMLRGDPIV